MINYWDGKEPLKPGMTVVYKGSRTEGSGLYPIPPSDQEVTLVALDLNSHGEVPVWICRWEKDGYLCVSPFVPEILAPKVIDPLAEITEEALNIYVKSNGTDLEAMRNVVEYVKNTVQNDTDVVSSDSYYEVTLLSDGGYFALTALDFPFTFKATPKELEVDSDGDIALSGALLGVISGDSDYFEESIKYLFFSYEATCKLKEKK